MKKMLLISVLFIAVLFLLTPAIPASQYSMVKEAKEEQIKQDFYLLDESELNIESISDIKHLLSDSKGKFSTSLFQNLNSLIKSETPESDPDNGGDVEPQALIFLGLFIYTVLFWIMFKIVLFVFNDISSFFEGIIDNIKSKFINFFSKIVEIIVSILTVIGAAAGGIINVIIIILKYIGVAVGGILNVIVTILLSILALGAGAVKLIINIIIFILFGIFKLAGLAWNTIGTIIALFFDILLLIFQTIFPNFNGS